MRSEPNRGGWRRLLVSIILFGAVAVTLYAAIVAQLFLKDPSVTAFAALTVALGVAAIWWSDLVLLARGVHRLWVAKSAVIGSYLAAVLSGVQAIWGWFFATDRFVGWTAVLAFLGAVLIPVSQCALLVGAASVIRREMRDRTSLTTGEGSGREG